MLDLKVSWETYKTVMDQLTCYYCPQAIGYQMYSVSDDFFIMSRLSTPEEIADFESFCKADSIEVASADDARLRGTEIVQKALIRPKTSDGKLQFVPNLLPDWCSLYFTGAGDDLSGLGLGQKFIHSSSDSSPADHDVEWTFSGQVFLVGGYMNFVNAELGDTLDYTVHAPATPTGAGSQEVVLMPYGGGNVIIPVPSGGMTTIDPAQGVPLPNTTGTGFWDWSDAPEGPGVLTPNYSQKGNFDLLDWELQLGHPAVKLPALGTGRLEFMMPNITPFRVMPQWLHRATIHNTGHSGLQVTWMLVGGRGGYV